MWQIRERSARSQGLSGQLRVSSLFSNNTGACYDEDQDACTMDRWIVRTEMKINRFGTGIFNEVEPATRCIELRKRHSSQWIDELCE